MKNVKKIILVLSLLSAVSTVSFSDDTKKLMDSFMCKKIRKAKLTELKNDLVLDCNLDKPFSIGESDIGVENSYTFCCHKK